MEQETNKDTHLPFFMVSVVSGELWTIVEPPGGHLAGRGGRRNQGCLQGINQSEIQETIHAEQEWGRERALKAGESHVQNSRDRRACVATQDGWSEGRWELREADGDTCRKRKS